MNLEYTHFYHLKYHMNFFSHRTNPVSTLMTLRTRTAWYR